MKKRERASDNRAPSVGIDLSIPIPRKESADSERIDVIIVVAHSSLAIENKEGRISTRVAANWELFHNGYYTGNGYNLGTGGVVSGKLIFIEL